MPSYDWTAVNNDGERIGIKRSGPNLSLYLGICLEGLRITTKNIQSRYSMSGRDSKWAPPEHKSETFFLYMVKLLVCGMQKQCLFCGVGS
jgi:hypothetical protein